MRIILTSVISAAVLIAINAGLAAADDLGSNYAPCASRSSDRCVQPEGGAPMHPGKMSGMHKGAMKKMGGPAPSMKMMGHMAPGGPGIPHGCSPATTPCQ